MTLYAYMYRLSFTKLARGSQKPTNVQVKMRFVGTALCNVQECLISIIKNDSCEPFLECISQWHCIQLMAN